MSSYKVKIDIDDHWVESFNKNGYKLIMAKVFEGHNGEEVFNTVASTNEVTGEMTAEWDDKYKICGSTKEFEVGSVISGNSPTLNVEFQETYILETWAKCHVEEDESLPSNTFAFKNTLAASAVVQLYIDGIYTPVYMSPLKFPPGKAKLTPLPKVVFWFEANLESKTMIAMDVTNPFQVDLSGGPAASIIYDKNGKWKRAA